MFRVWGFRASGLGFLGLRVLMGFKFSGFKGLGSLGLWVVVVKV